MIIAERQHLENLMQQQAVEIRVKEERVLSKSFQTLSKVSTYLAGSAFAILRCTPSWNTHNESYLDNNSNGNFKHGFRNEKEDMTIWVVTFTMGFASISLGFCILVLVISSWCLIFGQELAFRGEDQGSMTRAVDGLYAERKWAIRFFMCALASTLLAGISLVVLKIDSTFTLVPSLLLLCVGVVAFVYMRYTVRPRFRFPEGLTKTDKNDLFFAGGFDPEIRRNVETWVDPEADQATYG